MATGAESNPEARHLDEVRREALTMALYVTICLLAGTVAVLKNVLAGH